MARRLFPTPHDAVGQVHADDLRGSGGAGAGLHPPAAESLYEQLGGTYHLGEDGIYYPDLLPPEDDAPTYGKYGQMRRIYLKEHHEGIYTGLLLSGKLNAHLNEIDESAHARMELLTKQMAAAQGITEDLKAMDQMAWVGAIEYARHASEESVVHGLILT